MAKLALFDLDGTLSDDRERQHLYQEMRYKEYFSYEAQMSDPVWPEGRALYEEMLAEGWDIGYLSARLERNRAATDDWLTLKEFVNPTTCILRPEADDVIRPPRFKAAVVLDFINHGGYDQVVLVDNDPLVVERITLEAGSQYVFHATWDSRASHEAAHVEF